MHDITRGHLLEQAEHNDALAQRLSEEANIHLDRATELECRASACRKAADAFRADAKAKPIEKLTIRLDASDFAEEMEAFMARVKAASPDFVRAITRTECGTSTYDPR